MKRVLCCIAFVASLAAASAQENEPEIRAWVDRFVAAWNRNDAKALAAMWAQEGDLINPFGRRASGREQIERLLRSEHSALMQATTYTISTNAVRFVKTDVAVLDWDCEVSGLKTAGGKNRPPFKHHMTWVLVNRGGQWLALVARPAAPAASPAEAIQ